MGESKAAKIWRRTWIGALMVAAVTALITATHRTGRAELILAVTLPLGILGALELGRMQALVGAGLGRTALMAVLAFHLLSWSALTAQGVTGHPFVSGSAAGLLATAILSTVRIASRAVRPLRALALGLLLQTWVAVGLAWLVHVWLDWGTGGLVALVVLSKIGDIAGYYVGNAIGKSHPFPSISPGKTTAGCVGSLVAGVAAGAALAAGGVLPAGPLGIASGALAGLVVNLASQAGDLFESWVKRRTGVKDSATYFGPAGGVLDLVDSLLFSVPVAVLAWPLVFSA